MNEICLPQQFEQTVHLVPVCLVTRVGQLSHELVSRELAASVANREQRQLHCQGDVLATRAFGNVSGDDVSDVPLQQLDPILGDLTLNPGESSPHQVVIERRLVASGHLGGEGVLPRLGQRNVMEAAVLGKGQRPHLVDVGSSPEACRDALGGHLRRRACDDDAHVLLLGDALAKTLPVIRLLNLVEEEVASLLTRLGNLAPILVHHAVHDIGVHGLVAHIGEVEVEHPRPGHALVEEVCHELEQVEGLPATAHARDNVHEVEACRGRKVADDLITRNRTNDFLFDSAPHKRGVVGRHHWMTSILLKYFDSYSI